MVKEVLRTAAHFRNLADPALDSLARGFAERKIHAGETLYTVGEQADALFVVAQGTVVVFRGQCAEESRPLARLCSGDLLGAADLFSSERTETARATEESTVLRCSKAAVMRFLEDQPQVALNLRLAAARAFTARAKESLVVAQRRAVRHRVNREVRLTVAEMGFMPATLVDLSILGMSLRGAPDSWVPDAIVGYGLRWADRRLDLSGRIAWREGDYVGIELRDPSPEQKTEIRKTLEEMLRSAL